MVTASGREGEHQAPARITEESFSSRTEILRLRLRMTRLRGLSHDRHAALHTFPPPTVILSKAKDLGKNSK